MQVRAEAFWLPKAGSSEAEYEDAFRPKLKSAQEYDRNRLRFAVADGATESAFCRAWAKQLVRAFAKASIHMPITAADLKPLQRRWSEFVHRGPLPWYAEEKAKMGAFSTLLGLELSKDALSAEGGRKWRATAVGDSCLVQIVRGELAVAWPLTNSDQFDNSPSLLCSSEVNNCFESGVVWASEGCFGQDTTFFLMTDAVACWFMRAREQGGRPWRLLADLGTDAAPPFQELIGRLRSSREMKNDDVTLVRLEVFG